MALFDTRAKPWPVLFANETFAETAGKAVADCTGGGFWDQFEVVQAEGSKVRWRCARCCGWVGRTAQRARKVAGSPVERTARSWRFCQK